MKRTSFVCCPVLEHLHCFQFYIPNFFFFLIRTGWGILIQTSHSVSSRGSLVLSMILKRAGARPRTHPSKCNQSIYLSIPKVLCSHWPTAHKTPVSMGQFNCSNLPVLTHILLYSFSDSLILSKMTGLSYLVWPEFFFFYEMSVNAFRFVCYWFFFSFFKKCTWFLYVLCILTCSHLWILQNSASRLGYLGILNTFID